MAANDDRLGQLPDEILLFIFSLLPISSIARIAAVCKRWNGLFQYIQLQHTVLDFGQEFSSGRSADELVGSVGLSLRLLRGIKLKGFKLTFYPSINHMSELNTWLQCLVEKDVEDLELDFRLDYGPLIRDEFTEAEKKRFKLPSCLFDCKMITHFILSHSDFRIPSEFSCFSLLTELHLFVVNITDEMLERMIVTCPSMETLYLRECSNLSYVKICGTTLKLKLLAVMDMYTAGLDVYAPNLRKFHYNGDSDFNITNVSSLLDAIVCAVPGDGYDFDYNRVYLLDKLRHVEVLTVCSAVILGMSDDEEIEPEILPITFSNLYELQLLLDHGLQHDDLLAGFYIFFQHCTFPSLQKLFIELNILGCDISFREEKIVELDIPFQELYNLKMVRINKFCGHLNEIMLVEFLLKGAVALEYMILVAAADEGANGSASLQTRLSYALQRLLNFPKASSQAKIILYGCGENSGFSPTHTRSVYAPHYSG